MTHYAILTDRGVLAVSGPEASDFLQGLITKDMRKIAPSKAMFAALLSPQGRFLFDFFITPYEDQFLLETDKARLPELIKRLTMYRLRSQVQFTQRPDIKVMAVWNGAAEPKALVSYADPRLTELGSRILFTEETCAVGAMTPADYEHHRISLGVPEGSRDLIIDRSILLEYGYDELHGVDFDKGCYIGQEVTARSKHRANLRKFIHQVQAEDNLPPKGTSVLAAGREIGFMAESKGNIGLAHLQVHETAAAQGQAVLSAGGIALAAQLPGWCRTSFAEDILKP